MRVQDFQSGGCAIGIRVIRVIDDGDPRRSILDASESMRWRFNYFKRADDPLFVDTDYCAAGGGRKRLSTLCRPRR